MCKVFAALRKVLKAKAVNWPQFKYGVQLPDHELPCAAGEQKIQGYTSGDCYLAGSLWTKRQMSKLMMVCNVKHDGQYRA
jgi:hypothetical protein